MGSIQCLLFLLQNQYCSQYYDSFLSLYYPHEIKCLSIYSVSELCVTWLNRFKDCLSNYLKFFTKSVVGSIVFLSMLLLFINPFTLTLYLSLSIITRVIHFIGLGDNSINITNVFFIWSTHFSSEEYLWFKL